MLTSNFKIKTLGQCPHEETSCANDDFCSASIDYSIIGRSTSRPNGGGLSF